MTTPDRIYLRPIGAETPIMYASEAGSDDGQCEAYIKLSLYNEVMAQRDAAYNRGYEDCLQQCGDTIRAQALEEAAVVADNEMDSHVAIARAIRSEAKTLRGQLAKKKVPLNFSE